MPTEIIRVTKEFTFDMAHALFGYDGPCSNIHGHTYRLFVTIYGTIINELGHPKDGMLLDFGLLKQVVNQKIIQRYDHALLLNSAIPRAQKRGILLTSKKVLFVPYQPTCERLLLSIKNDLKTALDTLGFQIFALKLYETPTSYAEWCIRDN